MKVSALIFGILANTVILSVRGEWLTPPKCPFAVEMVFLKDFSDSFTEDMTMLASQLVTLLDNIDATYPGSRYGMGTYVDKPLEPFGYPYQGPWFEGDWCLDVTHPLDHTLGNQEMINQLMAHRRGGGNDWAENQLGAIHDTAKSNLARWSDKKVTPDGKPIKRMIVISTEDPYHVAGDGANSKWALSPNDGSPETDCTSEDYPTIDQVRDALQSRDIYTVFLVGSNPEEDVYGVYVELLNTLGIPGGVYNITSDSSDLLDAMQQAFADLEEEACSVAIDLVFSQDVTWSYTNDMPNFHTKISSLMDKMSSSYESVRFGLTTFGDKPLPPLGHGPSGDFCYRLDQDLTLDKTLVESAAASLSIVSGLDWRESQLDAIISSVLDGSISWRVGDKWNDLPLVRILVLATDAGFHRTPDAANAGHSLMPHSGGPMTPALCTAQEYPTWRQAAEALKAAKVYPVFVPTSDIARIYRRLLSDMESHYGIFGQVVELADFQNWVAPTATAIEKLIRRLRAERRV